MTNIERLHRLANICRDGNKNPLTITMDADSLIALDDEVQQVIGERNIYRRELDRERDKNRESNDA